MLDFETFSIIAIMFLISILLVIYYYNKDRFFIENSKGKVVERNRLLLDLEIVNERSRKREIVFEHIINCANVSFEDEFAFKRSMVDLVNSLRILFDSEYCAIGKVVNDLVEDYAFDYDMYTDKDLYTNQIIRFKEIRNVNINSTEYFVCLALSDKTKFLTHFGVEDIKNNYNNHYDLYLQVLKSGLLFNTTIIALRNDNLDNVGYIQFVNSRNDVLMEEIELFRNALLQLIQLVIKGERERILIERNRKFILDASFLSNIIKQKYDVDELLDNVMNYLSNEFNAGIISFRTPLLNGKEKEPFFYLRRCFISNRFSNAEEIANFLYKNCSLQSKSELKEYAKLRCSSDSDIICEDFVDNSFYMDSNIELNNKVIIIPIWNDISRNRCSKIDCSLLYDLIGGNDCVDRFENLYGIFKLRLFICKSSSETSFSEPNLLLFEDETKRRLSYISSQITLIFNMIVDKEENDVLRIFRRRFKEQRFLKVRDFDKQFVNIIKNSIGAKECSLYRYRMNDDLSNRLVLSATTSERILLNNRLYDTPSIINELSYVLTDLSSIVVRVFHEKKSMYLYSLSSCEYNDTFVELINNSNTSVLDESVFFVPIIKKDDDESCTGVVALFGKNKKVDTISDCYWEQDKGIIEFIVEMYTRISEADNERMTFLAQLGHELLSPVIELVQDNDLMISRFKLHPESLEKKDIMSQIRSNINNGLLFKHIISDIEHIYSSSIKDINYKIELQKDSKIILYEAIELFKSLAPIKVAVSNMPSLYMDKYKIKQVFINILKNAIRYSFKGQQIEIYYKSPDENDSGQHEIKFVNYGIGILDEDKEIVFELYKRGKNAHEKRAAGSGMGLYIVREIMRAHSGDCIIRSLNDPTEISLLFPKNLNKYV